MRVAGSRLGEGSAHVNCVSGKDADVCDVALELGKFVRAQDRFDDDSVVLGAILYAKNFQRDHLGGVAVRRWLGCSLMR